MDKFLTDDFFRINTSRKSILKMHTIQSAIAKQANIHGIHWNPLADPFALIGKMEREQFLKGFTGSPPKDRVARFQVDTKRHPIFSSSGSSSILFHHANWEGIGFL